MASFPRVSPLKAINILRKFVHQVGSIYKLVTYILGGRSEHTLRGVWKPSCAPGYTTLYHFPLFQLTHSHSDCSNVPANFMFIPCIFLHSILLRTNKIHRIKYNTTDHNTHFKSCINLYMFRQQGAIFRDLCVGPRQFYCCWYKCRNLHLIRSVFWDLLYSTLTFRHRASSI